MIWDGVSGREVKKTTVEEVAPPVNESGDLRKGILREPLVDEFFTDGKLGPNLSDFLPKKLTRWAKCVI